MAAPSGDCNLTVYLSVVNCEFRQVPEAVSLAYCSPSERSDEMTREAEEALESVPGSQLNQKSMVMHSLSSLFLTLSCFPLLHILHHQRNPYLLRVSELLKSYYQPFPPSSAVALCSSTINPVRDCFWQLHYQNVIMVKVTVLLIFPAMYCRQRQMTTWRGFGRGRRVLSSVRLSSSS